ncbi:ester cyclase [Streptomyces litchfieldiae]|uniref:Ester cyclase n=1 Tax=Streptomyces litchfieldiae TaxID=3075543 RepID=A0ABU2MX04_9ACTN|nr:ester cyclase [Streptomyces sp. DSM 44938]MDT0346140.1 ester cyclase [Streptomyces sp. DSM 44938]
MTFVQVIDFKTSRADELNRLMDTWVAQTEGKRTATHSVVGRDRSDSTHIVEIVEFPSYEDAERNARLPETDRIFREMAALCDDVPRFTDLDVVRDEQLNKAAVRRFFEDAVNRADLDLLDELCTGDYAEHDPSSSVDPADLASAKTDATKYIRAFGPTFLVEDQLAEGDLVTTRFTAIGTHTDDFMGLPATGRPVRIAGQVTHRFRDGRIAESWWNWDQLGLLAQIGLVEL